MQANSSEHRLTLVENDPFTAPLIDRLRDARQAVLQARWEEQDAREALERRRYVERTFLIQNTEGGISTFGPNQAAQQAAIEAILADNVDLIDAHDTLRVATSGREQAELEETMLLDTYRFERLTVMREAVQKGVSLGGGF